MQFELKFEENRKLVTLFIDTDILSVETETEETKLMPVSMAVLAPRYVGTWKEEEIKSFCEFYYGQKIIKPWGALFVSTLARMCGIDSQIPLTDSTFKILTALKNNKKLLDKGGYNLVQSGDIIFTASASGNLTNVGIIINNDTASKELTVIKSNGIDRVEEIRYPYSSPRIYAIGLIDYIKIFERG